MSIIEKIHYEKPLQPKSDTDIPPIVKTEMLVDLYFPQLKDVHNDFLAAKNKFGEEWAQILSRSFKAESLEAKQQLCGKFITLHRHIEDRLSAIQHRIQQIIKA